MEWTREQREGALVARPRGRVDEASWQDFSERLNGAVREAAPGKLVLDLAEVDYMSSRGLRALTMARKDAQGANVEIVLAAANERMREILAISRYDKIFRVVDAVEQGL
jgi:anti-anti-sigma factor